MSIDSAADKSHESDDGSPLPEFWENLKSKVSEKPSLDLLESWIEQDLAGLEREFAGFVSNQSLKSNLRKSRGSSDKH
jgi:hypothetical protein